MNRLTAAAFVLPLAIILGLLITLLALMGSLGPEVATHWDINGEPDGFTSTGVLPWFAAGLTAILVLPLGLFVARTKASIIAPRGLTALPAAMAMFMAVMMISSVFAQTDLDEAGVRTFSTPGWLLPAALAGSLIGAAMATVVAGRPAIPPTSTSPAAPEAERYPLDNNHVASWNGQTATGRVLITLAAITFLGFGVGAVMTNWFMLIPAALLALSILAGSQFSVSAGPGGVRVAGVAGFPTVTVPLDQIESVEAGSVSAKSFGGWGLRKSLSGHDAILTRSGPALVVTRTDGAKLHITIDDPALPASIMASLLDRRS